MRPVYRVVPVSLPPFARNEMQCSYPDALIFTVKNSAAWTSGAGRVVWHGSLLIAVIICTDASLIHHHSHTTTLETFISLKHPICLRRPFPIITHLIIFRNNLKTFCENRNFIWWTWTELGARVLPTNDHWVFVIQISTGKCCIRFSASTRWFLLLYSVICE